MKKNDIYRVTIEDLAMDGEGIARVDGQVVFVPYACVKEECDIQIINTKTKFAIGKIMKLYNKSEHRIEPPCPYFYQCGGCDIQHMDYEYQLKYKQKQLTTTLNRIGGITPLINECVASSKIYNYRNKFSFPITSINGKTIIGMYKKNTHKVIEIDDCIIQDSFVKSLLFITNKFIDEYNILGYNEEKGKGILRHLVCRNYENQLLITIVSTIKNIPHIHEYVEMLKKEYEIFGLEINVNSKDTNVIMGEKSYHIYGITKLEIKENEIMYSISNNSFMQVNNDIKNKIYSQVVNEIQNSQLVFDMYSGAGVLTALLAKNAKHVYGIEIEPSAVESANELMKLNHIENVTNICGDCSVELLKLKDTISNNATIVFDPPRKGLSEIVISTILEVTPNKIIYISCNPATLSRDLKLLSDKYNILSITPYDMFPQTKHLESVTVLNLK